MKKSILLLICITLLSSTSCSTDDFQKSTALEGTWLLQNISTGAKLEFTGKDFTIKSGSVTMKGTFELKGNAMKGQVVSRSGAGSGFLQPDTFSGNLKISDNRVTFTNFDGNWRAIFSTWYGKI